MANVFPQGGARFSFDGVLRLAQDANTVGTTYAFPCERIRFMSGDNAAYPDVIDAAQIPHIKSLGIVMGTLTATGILMPDRRFDAFAQLAFGPRTQGLLLPFLVNMLPYNSGSLIKVTGVYINRLTLSGQFSTRGDGMIIRFTIGALVIDPNNVFGCPTLSAAGNEGLQGAGPATFAKAGFTNGASVSPTVYQQVRSFDASFDNGFVVQPWVQDTTNRIAGGATPQSIRGALALTQLKQAANPIPAATSGSGYPFQILLPTGDGTHTMTMDLCESWDSVSTSMMPNDFYQGGSAYTLFGTSGINATGTNNYPVVFNYS